MIDIFAWNVTINQLMIADKVSVNWLIKLL